MPDLLLTGYGPFPGRSRLPWNITQLLVEALAGRVIGGVRVHSLVLPVRWHEAPRRALAAIERLRPRWVIALGMKGTGPGPRGTWLELEAFARNRDSIELLDESEPPLLSFQARALKAESAARGQGQQAARGQAQQAPGRLPAGRILAHQPDRLPPADAPWDRDPARLPLRHMLAQISRAGGTPGWIDEEAGTGAFLCNQLYFRLLAAAPSCGFRTVFIHVPSMVKTGASASSSPPPPPSPETLAPILTSLEAVIAGLPSGPEPI